VDDERRAEQAHDDSYYRRLAEREEARFRREWVPDNPDPDDPDRCRCGATAADPWCYCDG
jgi:hypothetical protein